jgi:hypothetical protein
MAEHKRKTKQERYAYAAYSYWGVSIMYSPAKHTNLYLRIGAGHFDYNLLRAEVKRLLHTQDFVVLNRWRAMANEYKSFIQFHERETSPYDPGMLKTTAGVGAEHW